MAEIDFTKEVVWHHVNSAIQANNIGKIETKMGMDPVTKRAALLLIDGAAPGAPTHAKILLISPSLPDATKSKAMKAAMKKEVPIAFALSDVSFHSTVLVIGSDFSDHALAKVQNSDTQVKKVTASTLDGAL